MADSEPIVFAIISGAPSAQLLLETMCKELSDACKREVSPLVLEDYDALPPKMERGQVHLLWAPPLIALRLEQTGVGKIRLCSNRGGRTAFSSAMFCRKGAPFKTVLDLKGKHVAWVDRQSSAGYVVPRLKLIAEGYKPETLFAMESFRRTHEAVASAVMRGEADVGATYLTRDEETQAVVSAGWFEAGATSDEVRVLFTAGPIPSDTITVSHKVAGELSGVLTKELQRLGERSPSLIRGLLNADGFVAAEGKHIEPLRAIVTRAETEQLV